MTPLAIGRAVPRAVWALLACAVAAASATRAEDPRPASASLEESVEVRRAFLPVLLEPRRPGGCDAIDPSWYRVVEGRASYDAVAVERQRLPTFQAILVDTSGSMVHRLSAARDAAEAYIATLPPNEPVLLATFDETLVLWGDRSTGRATLLEEIERVATGKTTRLWESVDRLVRYLDSRPERKVLLLLSDGCDRSGPRGPNPTEVVRRAAHAADLTVFPIGIELDPVCDRTSGIDPQMSLAMLARETGGESFTIDTAEELGQVLPRIRHRLAEEGFLLYAPAAHTPERRDGRPERLRIRHDRDATCRLRPAGSAFRRSFDPDFGGEVQVQADPATRRVSGVRDEVVEESDLSVERSSLAFDFRVPSLERIRSDGADWTRAVLDLLARTAEPTQEPAIDSDALDPGEAFWRAHPYLLHGDTWIDIRRPLARALFRFPDLRAWTERRLSVERVRRFAELSHGRRAAPDDPHRLDWPPSDEELQSSLAVWLPDVTAAEIAARLDLETARRTLAGAPLDEGVSASWQRLVDWVEQAPPGVGSLVPLVPLYDERLDRIGFRRVLLPKAVWSGRPPPPVPARPLATDLVALLLDAVRGTAAATLAELRLLDVRYERLVGRDRGRLRRTLERDLRRSTRATDWNVVEIDLAAGPSTTPMTLRAYWSIDDDDDGAAKGVLVGLVVPDDAASVAAAPGFAATVDRLEAAGVLPLLPHAP